MAEMDAPPSTSKTSLPKAKKSSGGRVVHAPVSAAQVSVFSGIPASVNKLQNLMFKNPGRKFADFNQTTDYLPPRRRTTVQPNGSDFPHHDYRGYLVNYVEKAEVTPTALCDCLRVTCEGCFPSCRKCGSRMCSFVCQRNRHAVIFMSTVECVGTKKDVYNPLMEKRAAKDFAANENYQSASESDDD